MTGNRSNRWNVLRSMYLLALSAGALAAGLAGAGRGSPGEVPRAGIVQAASSPLSGSCAPPCGERVLRHTIPLLRARQAAGARLSAAALQKRTPRAAPQRTPPPPSPPPPPPAPRPGRLTIDGRTYRVERTLWMTASAYGRGEPGVGPFTATGTRARVGEVAVDPRVIPLGSQLFIDGYHTPYLPRGGLLARAEDTGGAIRGQRVDIFLEAPLRAYDEFGLQRVRVLVLAPAR